MGGVAHFQGTVSSIRCDIAWTRIYSQPVKIAIGHCLMVFKLSSDYDPNVEMAEETEEKETKAQRYGFSDTVGDGRSPFVPLRAVLPDYFPVRLPAGKSSRMFAGHIAPSGEVVLVSRSFMLCGV